MDPCMENKNDADLGTAAKKKKDQDNNGHKLSPKPQDRAVLEEIPYDIKGAKNMKQPKVDCSINCGSSQPSKRNVGKAVQTRVVPNMVGCRKENEDVSCGTSEPSLNRSTLAFVQFRIQDVKTDMVERDGDPMLTLTVYAKQIVRDTFQMSFGKDADVITVSFMSCDPRLLSGFEGASSSTVFECTAQLKDKVVPSECTFKVDNTKVEMKLRKANVYTWGTVIMAAPKDIASEVAKNTWVPTSVGNSGKHPNIPPPPPVPPSLEHKVCEKPTCLSPHMRKSVNAMASSLPSTSGPLVPSCSVDPSARVCPRGLVGLDNIGNTCFMNSVLQCLVNTRELRDYFLDIKFQEDLNKENPLGMGGKLAVSFAVLIKRLWEGTVNSFAPTKLKDMMSLKANQFSGFAQHDAQEFMVELLDGLHEDLNRVLKKPYMAEPPDLDGWPDQEAADESWRLHKQRNDSVIDDLFKGQFKSTLQCHECKKISVKFDEFCCLSVPIPKDQKLMHILFFWRDTSRKPRKFSLWFPGNANVDDVKQALHVKTTVCPLAIQIFEVLKSKIHKVFTQGMSISSVPQDSLLLAFEVLTEKEGGGPVVQIMVTQRLTIPGRPLYCSCCSKKPSAGKKLRRCTKCYRAGYCDLDCQKNHWINHKPSCKLYPEPVGMPFIVSLLERDATHSNLCRAVEALANLSVDVFQPPMNQMKSTVTRRRRGSTSSGELFSETEEMEVDSDGSNELDIDRGTYSGEDRAEADWTMGGATGFQLGDGYPGDRGRRSSSLSSTSSGGEDIPQLSCSPSVKNVHHRRATSSSTLFSLLPVNSKLQNLTSGGDYLADKGVEPLDLCDVSCLAMDWNTNERQPIYCLVQNREIDCDAEEGENFQKNRNLTTLEACIDLFTQSENLSAGDCWRCPRCKKPVEAMKQMSIWRLPTVLIIQLKRFSFKHAIFSDKIDKFVQYPVRGLDITPYMSTKPKDGPAIYDLYGVINHTGRLLGGHYTSYCRTISEEDTKRSEIDWRLCDDSRVSFVNETRVVHDQAYLLMYRRRNYKFVLLKSMPPPPEPAKEEDEEFLKEEEMVMESSSSVLPNYDERESTSHEELD